MSAPLATVTSLSDWRSKPSATGDDVLRIGLGVTTSTTSTWDALVSDYSTYLQAARRSPGTVRLHLHYLRHLAGIVADPLHATVRDLRRALAVAHWKPETAKSARSTYVSFFGWAHTDGLIGHNPATLLDSIEVPGGVPRPIPENVYVEAIARAPNRERLMMRLAAHCGLRCAEIARVHAHDYDGTWLHVVGKGGKSRAVPVVVPELQAILVAAEGWLFPSTHGGHLTPAHVSVLINRLLPDPWTAHTLRHRYATRAYHGTGDLYATGQLLGHSRTETTQRYTQPIPEQLLAAARAAS